jgi:hypothetical protein
MKKNRIMIAALATIAFAFTIFVTNQAALDAESCRIVRLYGKPDASDSLTGLRIEPASLLVWKGDCVIWANWIAAQEVRIVFDDGKKCEDVTDGATGYKLDAKNCYVTSFVSPGGTSSLRFNELGTFKYEVVVGDTHKRKGEIVVKERGAK